MSVGILSLVVYIVAIVVINTFLKRRMAEAIIWSFIIILLIAQVTTGQAIGFLKEGLTFVFKQEVVFATMAFSYMAYIMDKTA